MSIEDELKRLIEQRRQVREQAEAQELQEEADLQARYERDRERVLRFCQEISIDAFMAEAAEAAEASLKLKPGTFSVLRNETPYKVYAGRQIVPRNPPPLVPVIETFGVTFFLCSGNFHTNRFTNEMSDVEIGFIVAYTKEVAPERDMALHVGECERAKYHGERPDLFYGEIGRGYTWHGREVLEDPVQLRLLIASTLAHRFFSK